MNIIFTMCALNSVSKYCATAGRTAKHRWEVGPFSGRIYKKAENSLPKIFLR